MHISDKTKTIHQEGGVPAKSFYGAVDPAVSLRVLKAVPTLKSAFSQRTAEEQSQDSHNLQPKKKKELKIAQLTLDAATLQSTKKLRELCFVNSINQSKLK